MSEQIITRGDKLARIQQIRLELEALESEYEILRTEAVVPMTEPEFIVGHDGRKYRVSPVYSSTTSYRLDRLDELTPEQTAAITETKIVAAKLKAAVEKEILDIDQAARLVTYTPKKPYPKYDVIAD